MATIYVWSTLVLVGLVCYYWYKRLTEASKNYLPSPGRIPFIGNLLHLFTMTHENVVQISERVGGSFTFRLFHVTFVFLTTAEDNKEIIVNQSDVFMGKTTPGFTPMLDINKYGYLFIEGPVWKEKRRFTIHQLKNFGFANASMETTILGELDRVCAILDNRETVAFRRFFFFPMLNIIWGIVASKTYEYDNEELTRVAQGIRTTFASAKCILPVIFPKLKHVPGDLFLIHQTKRSTQVVTDFIKKEIEEHLESLPDDEPRDFIDAFLQEVKKRNSPESTKDILCYDSNHLLGTIYDILQAGVETSSTTMEWILLYMVLWPEIQEKCQHELDTVIGRNRRPVHSDSPALPYVNATLLEVQRYSSMIAYCSPRVAKRTTSLRNHTIPKGAVVLQYLYAVHHEKKVWGDPEVFRPERFLTADGKGVTADGMMHFSIGPRNCIGEPLGKMELFLFFAGLIHRYSFSYATGKPPPSKVAIHKLTLHPIPFELVIRQRKM